jgi:hypothetical protein
VKDEMKRIKNVERDHPVSFLDSLLSRNTTLVKSRQTLDRRRRDAMKMRRMLHEQELIWEDKGRK